MAGLYVNSYRPWPAWVVEGNEEIARKFNAQIGTYRGHADRDPGHDMSGDLAADFWLYSNTKSRHDAVLAWFKANARRIGATYIITWRRIWSVDRAGEGVRYYGGSDPHTGHIHISYGTTPTKEDDDMGFTIKEIMETPVIDSPDGKTKWSLGGYVRNTRGQVDGVEEQLEEVKAQLALILKRLPVPASLDDSEGIE